MRATVEDQRLVSSAAAGDLVGAVEGATGATVLRALMVTRVGEGETVAAATAVAVTVEVDRAVRRVAAHRVAAVEAAAVNPAVPRHKSYIKGLELAMARPTFRV